MPLLGSVLGRQSGLVLGNCAKPGKPTITGTSGQYTQATISWTAGSTGGLSTTYTVYAVGGSSVSGASSPTTLTGLTNYQTYTVYVQATNICGTTLSDPATVYINVPCPAGTFINQFCVSGSEYPAFFGATCCYNRYCDGNGGIGQAFASGDCNVCNGVAWGAYCAGCSPGVCPPPPPPPPPPPAPPPPPPPAPPPPPPPAPPSFK
jgi:hypothetical protein